MDNELEQRILCLEKELQKATSPIELLASVLSRHQFSDSRFHDVPIAVLDRLDDIEQRSA